MCVNIYNLLKVFMCHVSVQYTLTEHFDRQLTNESKGFPSSKQNNLNITVDVITDNVRLHRCLFITVSILLLTIYSSETRHTPDDITSSTV